MSLVEQAIARMRNQARAAAPKNAAAGSTPAVPPPIVDQMAEPAAKPAAKPAKRMTLDMDAFRARGYLPEAGQDQQFADHYRRIKRPIQKPVRTREVTREEANRLIKECSGSLRPFVITLLFVDVGPGELLRLDWKQVDLDRATVQFRARNGRRTAKT